jgi:hypothetical protein
MDDDANEISVAAFLHKIAHAASINWAVFISTGTEIIFQIPHNLLPSLLHAHKGGLLEYPFAAYALADSRWAEYDGGNGLIREVCVRVHAARIDTIWLIAS